jgi:hypothetical protein
MIAVLSEPSTSSSSFVTRALENSTVEMVYIAKTKTMKTNLNRFSEHCLLPSAFSPCLRHLPIHCYSLNPQYLAKRLIYKLFYYVVPEKTARTIAQMNCTKKYLMGSSVVVLVVSLYFYVLLSTHWNRNSYYSSSSSL